MSDVEPVFSEAMSRFQARDALGAERLLRRALSQHPDHVPSLSLLAQIAGRAGRDAECIDLLERVIAHGTAEQAAAAGLWLGAAHNRSGRFAQAETAYRRAIGTDPASAEAHLQLGLFLHGLGRDVEAVTALRAAVGADARLARAHGALSSALYAIGEVTAAAEHTERAVGLDPANRAFVANLAVIRNAQGRFADAAALCRDLLATEQDPSLLNTVGVALKERGELAQAETSLEGALKLRPGYVDALYNLAAVRKDEGRTDEAINLLREVVVLRPDLPSARFALCMAHLAPLYLDEAEVEQRRADYSKELDQLTAHAERVGPDALAPGVGSAQPFYLAYQGRNDADLQRRYGELVCRAMAAAFPPAPMAAPPEPGERLRVGIVCGYLRDHSVWRLPTRGWVAGLDRGLFELTAFHTGAICDGETDLARRLFDNFVQGPFSVESWRQRIIEFRPHALIYPEVGMDPTVAQLAALRLAPAQYASWGHPSTTGYPTIDFYLSSDVMEPANGCDHYSETMVRLPGLSTAFYLPITDLAAHPRAPRWGSRLTRSSTCVASLSTNTSRSSIGYSLRSQRGFRGPASSSSSSLEARP